MKILVGIKHVPDTETKIKVAADGRSIDETGVKWVVSPYDEYALEQALLLREAAGGGEVVAVCAGRGASQASLRQALAVGADRAVLVEDERLESVDALVTWGEHELFVTLQGTNDSADPSDPSN